MPEDPHINIDKIRHEKNSPRCLGISRATALLSWKTMNEKTKMEYAPQWCVRQTTAHLLAQTFEDVCFRC